MNQENNFDEIDKILFDFFDNEPKQELPKSTRRTIDNTIRKIYYRKLYKLFNKVAIIIISLGIVITSIVFSNEIIAFIKSLFVNSTEGIDSAVENGYVQHVDMDYVYDKNIGIKVDNMVMDDTNLDISFIYEHSGVENIKSIELYEYDIKDENGKLIYEFKENKIYTTPFTTRLRTYNESEPIGENKYTESILLVSNEKLSLEKVICEITGLRIKSNNDEYYILNGNWNIECLLGDIFINRENIEYSVSDNDYINKSDVELTDTSLKINLEFVDNINQSLLDDKSNISFIDEYGNKHNYKTADFKSSKVLNLIYDFGKYSKNIENFKLIIILDTEEKIEIKFKKH